MSFYSKRLMGLVLLCFLFSFQNSCSFGGGTETGNPSSDSVALSLSDSVDVVSGVLGFEASGQNALLTVSSGMVLKTKGQENRVAALADGAGCLESNPAVTVTKDCDEAGHDALTVKNYGAGCAPGDGSVVTGVKNNSWVNMGAGACIDPSDKPSFTAAIQGVSTRQLLSSGDNISGGSCPGTLDEKITRTASDGSILESFACTSIDYSSFTNGAEGDSVTETVTPQELRVRRNSQGNIISQRSLSATTPLVITWQKLDSQTNPIRTIVSGALALTNQTEGYVVNSTFSNVAYNYNVCTCQPISGTISVALQDTEGASLGTASVEFTHDATNTCGTATATIAGQEVSLTLSPCY